MSIYECPSTDKLLARRIIHLIGLSISIGNIAGSLSVSQNQHFTVVIEQGKILQNHLQREHLTINNMMELLREKNVFNLAQVEFTVLERNGEMSVMKKTEDQPLSARSPATLVVNQRGPRTIVLDGNLMDRTLVAATLKKVQGDMEKFALETENPETKEAYTKDAAAITKSRRK